MKTAEAVAASIGIVTGRKESGEVEPIISIVIGAYDDWMPLEDCLRSLSRQVHAPAFEVIVVDDGSRQAIPQQMYHWNHRFPLTIQRQEHAGVSAARNRGIQLARGSILLFVDADSQLKPDCLAQLARCATNSPQSSCFQLCLQGNLDGIVGRAEELRLRTLQESLVRQDGCILYLNTAGFAIRRSRINLQYGLFNSAFLRGEDTALLGELMLDHELPLFAPDAVVQHAVRLSLLACFWKDIRLAGLSKKADDFITSKGLKVRMKSSERLAAMTHMWKISSATEIGKAAWFVVVARQGIQRLSSAVRTLLGQQ